MLCTDGRILLSQWTTSTVQNQSDYNVPSDYLEIMNVFLFRPDAKRQLWLRPLAERDPRQPTGTPERCFVHGANVSGNNAYVVILEPIPNSNGSSDLEIWGK